MAKATTDERTTGVLDERRESPGLLLALLGQAAMRTLRDAHTAHDLSPRQFLLLGLLHDQGATGQAELAQQMGIAASVLVHLLNPLDAAGEISRDRASDDRRRHIVTLTPKGERHLARAARAQREAEDQLFAGLTGRQRDDLRTVLVALRDSGTTTGPACDAAAHTPCEP